MRKTYTYIVLVVLLAFFGFSSVTYTSCKRDDSTMGCDTLKCLNWGACIDGKCTCPAGYDGYDCSIVLAEKFIDIKWLARETVVGSSDPIWINTTTQYNIRTRPGYTATSFFVDSLLGDKYKSNILCEIKSPTTFEIQQFQPINDPGAFKVLGGTGSIDTNGIDEMTGTYYRYISDSSGQRTDTVEFTFTD